MKSIKVNFILKTPQSVEDREKLLFVIVHDKGTLRNAVVLQWQ